MNAFSFVLFQKDFVNQHDLLRRRKHDEDEDTSIDEHNFDFRPYLKRFPLLKEKNIPAQSSEAVYQHCIKNLIREERIGTALAYKDSFNSILQFRGNLLFAGITVSVLHQYERWMLKKGRRRTTIGIKIRNLRAVFNEANSQGLIKKEKWYPFGRRK